MSHESLYLPLLLHLRLLRTIKGNINRVYEPMDPLSGHTNINIFLNIVSDNVYLLIIIIVFSILCLFSEILDYRKHYIL